MINKNGQKESFSEGYESKRGEIFKSFTRDIKELYKEFFGNSNLESKTEAPKQNSSISLIKSSNKFYGHLEEFRNHEAINPSRTTQKNNYFQKKNIFSFYSPTFGI